MSAVIEYITVDGDRWDLISYKFYGTPYLYEKIVVANPKVPIVPVLPGGLRLVIPEIDRIEILISEELPPWKR